MRDGRRRRRGREELYEAGSAYGPAVERSVEWWGQFEAFNAFQLMDERVGREDGRYRVAFSKRGPARTLRRPAVPGVCPRRTSAARSTASRRATSGS